MTSMSLLETQNELFGENNLIGRLAFGAIGLDLKQNGDPAAKRYLDVCMSIFDELNNKSESSQLISVVDSRKGEIAGGLRKDLDALEPLLKSIYLKKNAGKITEAR